MSNGNQFYAMSETATGNHTANNQITVKMVRGGRVVNKLIYQFSYEEGTWYSKTTRDLEAYPVRSGTMDERILNVYLANR